MGGIVSATAAEERERQRRQKRKERREKRRRRRLLKQQQQLDEFGNPLHFDAQGNQFSYDSEGNQFYVNENGTRFYIDDYGAPYYLEDDGNHYYLDENGEKFYLDENREPYYIDKNGQKFFLDNNGKKFFLDDKGNARPASDEPPDAKKPDLYKERRKSTCSRPMSEKVLQSVALDDKEMRFRSPATPFKTLTPGSSVDVEIFDHRESSGKSLKLDLDGKFSHSTLQPLSDISDFEQKYSGTLKSMEIPDETGGNNDDISTFGKLSPYSTLSFVKSEYEQDIATTPDYIKDESKESETRRTAQDEAEEKVLKKLLEKARESANLPLGKSYRKVGKFEIQVNTEQKDCLISGQAFLPDGNLIISDINNRKLKLFSQELEFLTSCETEFKPQSICSGTKDQLVHVLFKSRMNNSIQIFNCDDNKIVPKQTVRLYEPPFAVARSNQGLAVVVYDPNKAWQLNLMDLRCKLLRSIDLEDVLTNPECLAITADIKIFISDSGNNSVFCFSSKGEELFQYKQLREPRGLCTDGKGSVFITSPGVVHQVSESGERIKALMRREIIGFAPLGICYDTEDGLLVVTGESNNMTAFELK